MLEFQKVKIIRGGGSCALSLKSAFISLFAVNALTASVALADGDGTPSLPSQGRSMSSFRASLRRRAGSLCFPTGPIPFGDRVLL